MNLVYFPFVELFTYFLIIQNSPTRRKFEFLHYFLFSTKGKNPTRNKKKKSHAVQHLACFDTKVTFVTQKSLLLHKSHFCYTKVTFVIKSHFCYTKVTFVYKTQCDTWRPVTSHLLTPTHGEPMGRF